MVLFVSLRISPYNISPKKKAEATSHFYYCLHKNERNGIKYCTDTYDSQQQRRIRNTTIEEGAPYVCIITFWKRSFLFSAFVFPLLTLSLVYYEVELKGGTLIIATSTTTRKQNVTTCLPYWKPPKRICYKKFATCKISVRSTVLYLLRSYP